MGPCLVSIVCDDHRTLAAFYQTAFGFTEIEEVRSSIFTALRTPQVALGFHHRDAYNLLDLEEAPASGRVHLNIDVGDPSAVAVMAARLADLGAVIRKGPFETYYGATQVVAADPEGNIIRITTTQEALIPALP